MDRGEKRNNFKPGGNLKGYGIRGDETVDWWKKHNLKIENYNYVLFDEQN